MAMTISDVRNYRFIDRAIRMAQKRCDELQGLPVLTDKVYGSNPEFPYEAKGFNVNGSDMSVYDLQRRQYHAALAELQRLKGIKARIELIAASLTDVQDKIIFEGVMQGQSQTQIAVLLNVQQSCVSKKFRKILEKSSILE